jgi:ketosteroid isomerase-like protein
MKKFLLLCVGFPAFVCAQPQLDTDLQSLVDAEWAFIKMAKEKNTRDAFISFLADSAVTFAAAPRIGKKHLEKQSDDASWLYWEPEYSDIAASGDFGFNAGPWELRENRSSEQAVAYGHFITVWKKVDGIWKAAIDIGIAHTKPELKEPWTTSSMPLKNVQATSKSILQRVVAEEQKFLKEYASKKLVAYSAFLSDEARIYRHQHQPSSGKDIVKIETPRAIDYKYVDGEISSSGDLAYVYGQALVEVLEEGKRRTVEGNYMRIWKKEDGKNWKIVVDVLRYL